MIRYDQPQKYLDGRQNMPTAKTSRELAEESPKIRAHAFFSARVAEARVLDRMRSISDDYSAGRIDFATARWKMREFLASAEGGGHDPTKRGVVNLASTARIDLVLRQNAAMAAAVGQYEQEMDEDAMDLWPNWRYVHGKSRKPKTARMDHKSWDGKVFKKTDPIWRKIFPPNGFGCSCGVEQCDDDEAARYGGVIDGSNLPIDPSPDGFAFDPAHAFEDLDPAKTGLSPAGQQYVRAAVQQQQDQADAAFAAQKERWLEDIRKSTQNDAIAKVMDDLYDPSMSRLGDPPAVIYDRSARCTHFDPARNRIVVKTNDLAEWMSCKSTLRHEYGHWIHYRAMERDAGLRDRIATAAGADWSAIKAIYSARKKSGIGGLHELDELYGDNSMVETFARQLFGQSYSELGVDQRHAVIGVCDTIGSISNGAHGTGHSKAYYKSQNARPGAYSEAIANVYAMREFLPEEKIKLAFPEIHAIITSMEV